MTFAIITPALIVGAFVERIKFSAVLLFSLLWSIVVYAPVAHWVWGGGWLFNMGVQDFAGGLVVHMTCGISALVLAALAGKCEDWCCSTYDPHLSSQFWLKNARNGAARPPDPRLSSQFELKSTRTCAVRPLIRTCPRTFAPNPRTLAHSRRKSSNPCTKSSNPGPLQ